MNKKAAKSQANNEKQLFPKAGTLNECESECESILDAMVDGLSIHDLDFNIVRVNKALADMLGVTKQDLMGRKCYEIFHGLSGPIINCPHARAIQTKKPAYLRLEEPYLGRKVFRVSSTPLFDAGGNVTGTVHNVRDITYQESLAQSKRQATEELRRSNEELEEFAYVASHDMQEPLRTVSSYVQLLERRYADKLDSDARDFIAFAADGAARMQAMISDLSAYSRIGRREREFLPTDFEKALSEALANLESAIMESNAEVTIGPLPVIVADSSQITVLFQNLVGNAIKFRQEGVTPRVHVSAEKQGEKWVFSVSDNGIGIDPKNFDRIFVIFQQLHPPDTYPGTGIGLAICKRIVERHGGSIWVESDPGKGTTFYFAIPGGRYGTDTDVFGRQRLRW